MEIKVNKEIRQYQESIFFGLTLRQFVCSILALLVAIGIYFLLKKPLGEETVSWLCIVAASPIAFMGFFQYQQMTAEQFVWAVIKNKLSSRPRVFDAENLYEMAYHGKPAGRKNKKKRRVDQ